VKDGRLQMGFADRRPDRTHDKPAAHELPCEEEGEEEDGLSAYWLLADLLNAGWLSPLHLYTSFTK